MKSFKQDRITHVLLRDDRQLEKPTSNTETKRSQWSTWVIPQLETSAMGDVMRFHIFTCPFTCTSIIEKNAIYDHDQGLDSKVDAYCPMQGFSLLEQVSRVWDECLRNCESPTRNKEPLSQWNEAITKNFGRPRLYFSSKGPARTERCFTDWFDWNSTRKKKIGDFSLYLILRLLSFALNWRVVHAKKSYTTESKPTKLYPGSRPTTWRRRRAIGHRTTALQVSISARTIRSVLRIPGKKRKKMLKSENATLTRLPRWTCFVLIRKPLNLKRRKKKRWILVIRTTR